MFLVNWFGRFWYGKEEWQRRKQGLHNVDDTIVEPYFSHPLDREAWKLRKQRFRTHGHTGQPAEKESTPRVKLMGTTKKQPTSGLVRYAIRVSSDTGRT